MNSHFIQQIITYYYHCFYAQNDQGLPSESRLKLFPVSFWHIPYLSLNSSFLYVVVPNSNTSLLYGSDPQLFWHQRPFSWKTTFPWGGWRWFKDDSSTLHLLCTLFLLLLHQLHLRSSGIRSWSLGTPALWNSKIFQAHLLLLCPRPKISNLSMEYFKVEIVFRSQGLRLAVHHVTAHRPSWWTELGNIYMNDTKIYIHVNFYNSLYWIPWAHTNTVSEQLLFRH